MTITSQVACTVADIDRRSTVAYGLLLQAMERDEAIRDELIQRVLDLNGKSLQAVSEDLILAAQARQAVAGVHRLRLSLVDPDIFPPGHDRHAEHAEVIDAIATSTGLMDRTWQHFFGEAVDVPAAATFSLS